MEGNQSMVTAARELILCCIAVSVTGIVIVLGVAWLLLFEGVERDGTLAYAGAVLIIGFLFQAWIAVGLYWRASGLGRKITSLFIFY